jgi:hypothetical protein
MADVEEPEPPIAPVAIPAFYRNPGEYVAAGADYVDWGSDREIKN